MAQLTHKPIYRAEIRAPRSELIFTGVSNPSETAILLPPAGLAHRDWFRVATAPVGYGIELEGETSSYATRNPVASWPTGDFSLDFWVRVDDPRRNMGIVSYAVAGNFNMFLMFITASIAPGTVSFELAGGAGGGNFTSATLVDGRWHHVVFTRTAAGQGTSYLDGVQQVSSAGTGTAMTGGGSLVIGQEQDAVGLGALDAQQALIGAVDDVKIYGRVLSAQEVAERFRGIVTSTASEILRWGFDEGYGFVANDASGIGNHGTLLNVKHVHETPISYKPYLAPLRGRRGRIDLLQRRLDVGSLTLTLLDRRVPVAGTGTLTNLKRWWSAFFGDANGKPRGKLKVLVEESLDGGVTWATFATARLVGSSVDRKASVTLTIHDEADALQNDVFVGVPHASITYAAVPTLMPLGVINSDYGRLVKVAPLTGLTADQTVGGFGIIPTELKTVTLDGASITNPGNIVTANLLETVAPNDVYRWSTPGTNYPGTSGMISLPNFSGSCRVRLKHLSGALVGQTGDYKVGGLGLAPFGSPLHTHLASFSIKALDVGDKGYLALPAAAVSVEVTIFVDAKISKDNPLLLNDVDPATLLQDLCDGKFGYLYRSPEPLPAGKAYGDAKRTIATNSFAALVGTQPPFRGRITSREKLLDWIEKNLLKQYHWAIYLDRSGRLTLVDLRLPSSLAGIPTISDADLATARPLSWEHDPTSAITRVEFKRYFDTPVGPDDLLADAAVHPRLPKNGIIEEQEHAFVVLDIGSTDFGDQPYEVDARGYRAMSEEQLQGQSRLIYLEHKLEELADHLRRPFGFGTTTIRLPCRRTATVSALTQGALVLVAMSHVPDPSTGGRGGIRLCRVLEISEDGPIANLELIDLAMNQAAGTPALGVPALESGNAYSGVTTVVSLNAANHPVEVRYAITTTGVGTIPVDTSPLWVVAAFVRSAGTVTIRNVPPGSRVWVQGRSFPDYGTGVQQVPSPWVVAGSPGRVDTTALPAPSAPTNPAKTNVSATIEWTNGATDLVVDVLLATPVGDPRVRVASLMPGSTRFEFRDLLPSTTYRAEVRHAFGQHPGPGVTIDFTTNASGNAAPAIVGIEILKVV